LLVEDNEYFALTFAQLLMAFPGLEVEIIPVGSLAEARARLSEGGLDAALVDLNLPDGDGITLISEISGTVPSLPSLAFTGLIEQDTLARAMEAGAAGLLDKMGSLEEISEAIKSLWDR
jgi:DNA-binding NarL/FixJ family response regulator